MKTQNTFTIADKEINIALTLDDVIDYNAENGLEKGDADYIENHIGINVRVEINDDVELVQAQYDNLNNCYSLDCDGNSAGDIIRSAVLSNFTKDELIEDGIDSDLRCNIENNHFPLIEKFILEFAEEQA